MVVNNVIIAFTGLYVAFRFKSWFLKCFGLNFYFDHNMIHTIVIHAYLYRIWSKALWLILTISTYCKFIDIECIPKIEMQI